MGPDDIRRSIVQAWNSATEGDLEDALVYYTLVSQADIPEAWQLRYNLSCILLKLRSYDEARGILLDLRQAHRSDFRILQALVYCLYQQRFLKDAIQKLEQSLKDNPDWIGARLLAVRIFMELKQPKKALKILQGHLYPKCPLEAAFLLIRIGDQVKRIAAVAEGFELLRTRIGYSSPSTQAPAGTSPTKERQARCSNPSTNQVLDPTP